MGKHSNIIFCDEDNVILDSIKHISAQVSSVREVLPGRDYFIPHSGEKKNPLTITETELKELRTAHRRIFPKRLHGSYRLKSHGLPLRSAIWHP